MKTEKKLKQGLADLSRLFSAHYEFWPKKEAKATLMIEPPVEVPVYAHLPHLITAAFSTPCFDARERFNFIRLAKGLEMTFEKIFILSVESSQLRNGEPLVTNGEHAKGKTLISFYPAGEKISLANISVNQMRSLLELEIASSHQSLDFVRSKRALLIWDLVSMDHSLRDSLFFGDSVFEVMDHYVLITQANSDQIMDVYEQIRSLSRRRKGIRCSILLMGRGAETMWEFVYERLNGIVSRFLGCDIGFLGWIEGDQMHLNPELLLEEGNSCVQLSSKARLGEMFYASALNE